MIAGHILAPAAREAGPLGDIDLDADDRLDTGFPGLLEKFYRPVHVAVIGQRQRLHSHFFRFVHEPVDFRQTVQQGIVRVGVEMDEFRHGFLRPHYKLKFCSSPNLLLIFGNRVYNESVRGRLAFK